MKINPKLLLDVIYPVGSYYETSNTNFDPNTAWGGTWVEDSKGRVLVGQDTSQTEFNTIGKSGGSKTHRHDYKIALFDNNYAPTGGFAGMSAYNETARGGAYKYSTNEWAGASGTGISKTQMAGKTSTAENTSTELMSSQGDTDVASSLQPYVVVKRWHRTA